MERLLHLYSLNDKQCRKELQYKHDLKAGIEYLYKPGKNILLIAHYDTVFQSPPKQLKVANEIIWNEDMVTGIGADDRNGIYIVEKLSAMFPEFGILFTEEEYAGHGITNFWQRYAKECAGYNLSIEFDKAGHNGYCTYGYDIDGLNMSKYGLWKLSGTYTDISTLLSYSIPAINLTNGGHNSHSINEYTNWNELTYMIGIAIDIIHDYKDNTTLTVKSKIYQRDYQYNYKDYSKDYTSTSVSLYDKYIANAQPIKQKKKKGTSKHPTYDRMKSLKAVEMLDIIAEDLYSEMANKDIVEMEEIGRCLTSLEEDQLLEYVYDCIKYEEVNMSSKYYKLYPGELGYYSREFGYDENLEIGAVKDNGSYFIKAIDVVEYEDSNIPNTSNGESEYYSDGEIIDDGDIVSDTDNNWVYCCYCSREIFTNEEFFWTNDGEPLCNECYAAIVCYDKDNDIIKEAEENDS